MGNTEPFSSNGCAPAELINIVFTYVVGPYVSSLEEKIIILRFLSLEPLSPEGAVVFEKRQCRLLVFPGALSCDVPRRASLGRLSLGAPRPLTAGDVICLIRVTGRV